MYKKFGFKDDQKVMHRIMEGDDVPGYDQREEVMDKIQGLITSGYFLGINPLRGLRNAFPQYQWVFHRTKNRQEIVRRVVSSVDFIWLVAGFVPTGEENLEFVTATKADRPEHFVLFFAGKYAGPGSNGGRIADFAKSVGGEATFS